MGEHKMYPVKLPTIIIFIIFGLSSSFVEINAAYNLVVPGTKWCGDGSTAMNYNDLGKFRETDMCCRAHHNCKDTIAVGESKYGLKNTGLFTRLHCQCESEFFNCLNESTDSAKKVILTYFTNFDQKCFSFRYPATCSVYYDKSKNVCQKYKFNASLPRKWQWFDIAMITTNE